MARRSRKSAPRNEQVRTLLAHEAARLVTEHASPEPRHALRKAMQRLGVSDETLLPTPEELDQAIREHRRLFGGDAQAGALESRRRAALEAMAFLAPFEPRLVGAVLDGSATGHSPVQLHLFCDDADAVARFLIEHRIPFRAGAQRLRQRPGHESLYPRHCFVADEIEFELTVFPRDGLREAPLERGGERRMQRANAAAVRALLDADSPADGAG